MAQYQKQWEDLHKNGGFTLTSKGEVFTPHQGYQVGLKTFLKTALSDLSENGFGFIMTMAVSNADENFVGGWIEKVDGIQYLFIDYSMHIQDFIEAMESADVCDQLAIYDHRRGISWYVADFPKIAEVRRSRD